MDPRTFLKRILYTKAEIDDWLSGRTHKMEKYDPELGWVLNTCCARDGVDGAISMYTFDESGARRMASRIRPETNRSRSFTVLIEAIRRTAAALGPVAPIAGGA